MSKNSPQVKVFIPGKEDKVSVRNIPASDEDRAKFAKEFREQKNHESEMKDQRFKKIEKLRRNRNAPSGKGSGINIEVTSDS